MNRLFALLALFLCACGGGGGATSEQVATAVQTLTTSRYYPFTVGSSIYDTYLMTGTWNGVSIDAVQGEFYGSFRVDHTMYSGCAGTQQPVYMSAFHSSPADNQAVDWGNQISDGYATKDGIAYIGEIYQQFGFPNPDSGGNGQPEAKLTLNPIVGEVLTGTAVLYKDCALSAVQGYEPWIYHTVKKLPNGDLVTSLQETRTTWVYQYAWGLDCGLKEMAWGPVTSGNQVKGFIVKFPCPHKG